MMDEPFTKLTILTYVDNNNPRGTTKTKYVNGYASIMGGFLIVGITPDEDNDIDVGMIKTVHVLPLSDIKSMQIQNPDAIKKTDQGHKDKGVI